MNIKGFISNIFPTNEVRNVETIGKTIKSDSTNDRDANGQEQYQNPQDHPRPPMTEEDLDKALQHLQKLSAIKEHRWNVEVDNSQGVGNAFIVVKDNLGKVIRRIPENELWSLPADDSPRGQLLKRSA